MSKLHLILIYTLLTASLALAGLAYWKAPLPSTTTEYIAAEPMDLPPQMSFRDSIRLFEIPKDLDFAGEKVPLENGDILERLEREIYVNAYWESNMIVLLKR